MALHEAGMRVKVKAQIASWRKQLQYVNNEQFGNSATSATTRVGRSALCLHKFTAEP